MPPVIIAAVAYAVGAIAVEQLIVVAALYAFSTYQAQQARRKAKNDYNQSLRDRLVMVAMADGGARSRLYGRVRNTDGVLFKATYGPRSEFYRLIVALAGHECDAIEQAYFNDQLLTLSAPDAYGWQLVLDAPYNRSDVVSDAITVTPTHSAQTVTLPPGFIASSIAVWGGDGSTESSGAPISFTLAGSVITFTAPAEAATVQVSYQVGTQQSMAAVRKWLGTPTQNIATAGLMSDFPGLVQSTDRFAGICCLEVILSYDTDVWPSGVPSITGVVRGAKLLDPRTSTTAWSEDPALIAYDWATYANGGGCPVDVVDVGDVMAAANTCDITHAFTTPAGTQTLPLYTAGIAIKTDSDPAQAMDEIVEAMAGKWGWGGGMLRLRAGAYTAPVVTIDESWLSGADSIQIVPEPPADQAVNTVRASIANKANAYTVAPVPDLVAAAYVSNDGQTLLRETAYGAVTDAVHAQHISGVVMRDERSGLAVQLSCNLKALQVGIFRNVTLNLARFGWSGKAFEVLGWSFNQTGGVTLGLKETAASIWDPDALFTENDATPNTALFDPFDVPSITGITCASGTAQLVKQADGTIVSRILVQWDAVDNESVRSGTGRILLSYRTVFTDDDTGWATVELPGDAEQAYIDGVQDGVFYLVKLRARNALGIRGPWSVHAPVRVIGKTARPLNVAGLTVLGVQGGVVIQCTADAEVDYAATEFRLGSWVGGAPLFKGAANRYFWAWPAQGSYTVYAKHIDTSGNESADASSISFNITAAGLGIKINVNDFAGTVNYNEAYIHGVDLTGSAVDAPGKISVNGVQTPVPNGPLNTNRGPVPNGYILWDVTGPTFSFGSTPNARHYVMARRNAGAWEYDNNDTGWLPITPPATTVAIGTITTGGVDAGNPGSPPGITSATMWTNAVDCASVAAQADAADAATVAAAALAAANAANSAIADIAADNVLTPSEKPALIQDYAVLTAEQAGIDAQATAYSITTEKTAYDSAITALTSYLGGLTSPVAWNNLSGNTSITGSTLRTKFGDAYTTRQTLLNKIAEVAGTRANWAMVTGTGKPSDNATSDLVLIARGSCSVQGNVASKGAGTSAWDSDVYSRDSYTGGAFASAVARRTTDGVFFGLNSDPDYNRSYDSIDYAWYLAVDGTARVWINGTQVVSAGGYSAGDVFAVTYDGSNIVWLLNGVVYQTSVASNSSMKLYFDSSFLSVGATLDNIRFGPMTNNVWASIGGANKPADNATVGAPAGTYVGGTLSQTVESNAANALANAATAQSTANTAATNASSALTVLADISADNVLTPGEKPSLIQDYSVLTTEQSGIDAQATAYSITTEKTAYDNAISALTSYLGGLTSPVAWNDLSGNTNITGSTLRTKFGDAYTTRQTLLNKIAAVAGTIASWAGVSGSGKPADNATVGATFGVNITGQAQTADLAPGAATDFAATYIDNDVWSIPTGAGPAYLHILASTSKTNPTSGTVQLEVTFSAITRVTAGSGVSNLAKYQFLRFYRDGSFWFNVPAVYPDPQFFNDLAPGGVRDQTHNYVELVDVTAGQTITVEFVISINPGSGNSGASLQTSALALRLTLVKR